MSSVTLPTGKSDARYSTSAAVAETEASTTQLSNQVQQNANQLHTAATDAARSAQSNEPKAASAVGQLEQGLSEKTNAAATQGAHDVESAKAAAAGYVEQAKHLAGDALSTAQDYLASAQAAAKPYIESAAGTAQAQVAKAKSAISGGETGSSISGRPSEVPSTTAQLESGPRVVGDANPDSPEATRRRRSRNCRTRGRTMNRLRLAVDDWELVASLYLHYVDVIV